MCYTLQILRSTVTEKCLMKPFLQNYILISRFRAFQGFLTCNRSRPLPANIFDRPNLYGSFLFIWFPSDHFCQIGFNSDNWFQEDSFLEWCIRETGHIPRWQCFFIYSKTCVKLPLSKRPQIGFQDQLLLNAGQKYCRMLQGEHSAILSTFNKLPFVIKIFILFIFEWPFYTGFTVSNLFKVFCWSPWEHFCHITVVSGDFLVSSAAKSYSSWWLC